ncbi:MAG: hypothetical protein C0525_10995 [Flavobacterium sp.]|uniref:hypothetical protein n=1 Tax=Flavobacterium sp. TaxID=239 RepID=UPI0025C64ABE|nr:hypothetical protein [Flavobacterium sp.]MBA4135240.1 hypothetical protein [Flavobacterium sp.]
MKHPWLYILWLYPLAMFGQESTTKATCYLKIIIGKEVTTYYFDQVNDLEEHCEKILKGIIIPENKKKRKDKIPETEVEISILYNNQTASETVTADLEILKETIQKLKIQLQIPPKE